MSKVTTLKCEQPNRFPHITASQLNNSEQDYVVSLAITILEERFKPGETLTKPSDTCDYLRLLLGERKDEIFGCIYLDNRNQILSTEELFHGTIDGASVYPRVIVRRALEVNAACCMFFHNHPSGVTQPSEADVRITERLKKALATVDIRTLDHIIIGASETTAFSERGLI